MPDSIADVVRRMGWLLALAYTVGVVSVLFAAPNAWPAIVGASGVGLMLGVRWWRRLWRQLARSVAQERENAAWDARVAAETAAGVRLTAQAVVSQTISAGRGFDTF